MGIITQLITGGAPPCRIDPWKAAATHADSPDVHWWATLSAAGVERYSGGGQQELIPSYYLLVNTHENPLSGGSTALVWKAGDCRGHTLNWWVEIKPGWLYFDLPLGSRIVVKSVDQTCHFYPFFRSWKLCSHSWWVNSPMLLQCCLNSNACVSCQNVYFLHLFVLCPLDQLDEIQASATFIHYSGDQSPSFLLIKPIILIDFAVWILPIVKSKHWKQFTFIHFLSYHVWIRIFLLHQS